MLVQRGALLPRTQIPEVRGLTFFCSRRDGGALGASDDIKLSANCGVASDAARARRGASKDTSPRHTVWMHM